MLTLTLKRLLIALTTLWVLVTLAFLVLQAAPAGPLTGEPALTQYFGYLGDLTRGDLGASLRYEGHSVGRLISQGLPVSVTLGLGALALALVLGTAAGIFAALRQNRAADHAVMTLVRAGLCVPSFVAAPLLILGFAVAMPWLPAAGWNDGSWRNLLLPILALALPQAAVIALLARRALNEALRQGQARNGRALLPLAPHLGPAIGSLVTGSVVIEQIFDLPGIGRYFVQGALHQDYTLVLGVLVLYGAVITLCNLAADLLHGVLDSPGQQP